MMRRRSPRIVIALGAAALAFGIGTAAAQAPGSAQDFVVNAGDRVFFVGDADALDRRAREALARQAVWLRRHPHVTVTVEGHTDDRGTNEWNIALGARRARAVADFLIAQGVAGARIRTISYGGFRPVAVCPDVSCWSQNRRAVTVVDGR